LLPTECRRDASRPLITNEYCWVSSPLGNLYLAAQSRLADYRRAWPTDNCKTSSRFGQDAHGGVGCIDSIPNGVQARIRARKRRLPRRCHPLCEGAAKEHQGGHGILQ